jgi:hypothetical protein
MYQDLIAGAIVISLIFMRRWAIKKFHELLNETNKKEEE